MGQLPLKQLTPGTVFWENWSWLRWSSIHYYKYDHVRKPVIFKSYVSVFVSLSIKAVHLELVTDLTSDAFISCLRRFIARHGYPFLLWSDHDTNFTGANREMKKLIDYLKKRKRQKEISEFCTLNNIKWKFISQHSHHFGGIWEAAVKSFKTHLKRILGNIRLNIWRDVYKLRLAWTAVHYTMLTLAHFCGPAWVSPVCLTV